MSNEELKETARVKGIEHTITALHATDIRARELKKRCTNQGWTKAKRGANRLFLCTRLVTTLVEG